MDQPEIHQETLFNAGVDTALEISKLAKQAEYYASMGDYPRQFLKFESMEMWMSPKFRNKKEANDELKEIKKKHIESYKRYIKKWERDKKISGKLTEEIKGFLTEYGKCLMFWRDKFGYGMPVKDDSRFALG